MDVKGSSWNHKNQRRTFIFGAVFSAVLSPVHHIEYSCSCCLLRDGGVLCQFPPPLNPTVWSWDIPVPINTAVMSAV